MRLNKKTSSMRRAFTLVEVVISIAVGSILLIAMGSILVLVSKSVPQSTAASTLITKNTRLVFDMSRQMRNAITVSSATATEFTFVVADRDGDNNNDTITYAYNTTNNRLLYQFNASTRTVIADDIGRFQFKYNTISKKDAAVRIFDVEINLQSTDDLNTRVIQRVRLPNKPSVN